MVGLCDYGIMHYAVMRLSDYAIMHYALCIIHYAFCIMQNVGNSDLVAGREEIVLQI